MTIEKLGNAFSPFEAHKTDRTVLSAERPIFSDKPSIDTYGILNLTGYFLHDNFKYTFNFQSTYAYPEWKLIGMRVNVYAE